MTLAYLLVWSWQEHQEAAKLLGEKTTTQVTFLIDEIESHLHPKWQLSIVPALLNTMDNLASKSQVQIIAATHSPLVMTSLEPIFDAVQDAWFDLDLEKNAIVLSKRDFEKLGEANDWLTSEAFDLKSSRSREYAKLVAEAAKMLQDENAKPAALRAMHKELVAALNPLDTFLLRWRVLCERKGVKL